MQEYHFKALKGRKTLIVGESGVGKTRLTAELVEEAAAEEGSAKITILDFAPAGRQVGNVKVGGSIQAFLRSKKYGRLDSSPAIRAPRLESRSVEEVWELAKQNADLTSEWLRKFVRLSSLILFINDLTIHIHAGDIDLLLKAIDSSQTFVGNAYKGSVLASDHGSGLSVREKENLRIVERAMDNVIDLHRPSGIELNRGVKLGGESNG